jgi:hypothetical protein
MALHGIESGGAALVASGRCIRGWDGAPVPWVQQKWVWWWAAGGSWWARCRRRDGRYRYRGRGEGAATLPRARLTC